MSATTEPLDIRAIVARIDRDIAESEKLRDETRKFVAEQRKLAAEHDKLAAEALKLERDRKLSPWLVIAGVAGGLVTVANLLVQAIVRVH